MKNIFIILIINLLFVSCIDIIKSSDEDYYESIYIQGGGWFEFDQNNQEESLVLNDNFTLQIWFSGQEDTGDEATCIAYLKGDASNIAIYRNPNIDNIIMIYNNDELITEVTLDTIDFSQSQNFYLLSVVRNNDEISLYLNDYQIMGDDNSPVIIESSETIKPFVGAVINNDNPENLWYGYIDEIRIWNIALHDTIINFHNQYPTKISSSYNDNYLESLNGLWDFKISVSEGDISNIFQDINDNLSYTIIYTLESMSNELSKIGR